MCRLVYIYVCVGIRVCMYYVSMCVYAYVCVCISSCVFGCVLQRLWTRSCNLNLVIGGSVWCSLWTRYTSGSTTDTQDDPKIRTSLYIEDQKAIRIQNRVISCECLLICTVIYLFLLLNDLHFV